MLTYIVIIGALLLCALLVVAWKIGFLRKPEEYPYSSNEILCTPAERSFLGVVEKILGDRYRVFVKVRLSDIIRVHGGLPPSVRRSAFNKISKKHADFVVCNADDMSIAGVFELDDDSHEDVARRERDQFLNNALGASGIPIIHVVARTSYPIEDIRRRIGAMLKAGEAISKEKGGESEPPKDTVSRESDEDEKKSSITETGEPVCPKCGALLQKKVASKGKYAGQRFWGCSNFPECRFIAKRSD